MARELAVLHCGLACYFELSHRNASLACTSACPGTAVHLKVATAEITTSAAAAAAESDNMCTAD